MANDLTGQSIQIGDVTYNYDDTVQAYTSEYSNYYINASDGDIFEKNYDNQDGNLFDWSLYVSNYFDNGSAPSTSSSSGSFFDKLLAGVANYATNQQFINGELGKLTGVPVSNTPNQGATPNPHGTGTVTPTPKKSNTTLYIVGGVLVVGIIVTIVVLKNKKK